MSKQQTAVEWLINELKKSKDYQRVINEVNQSSTTIKDVIQQAKEMEYKQHKAMNEIENAMERWHLVRDNDDETLEEINSILVSVGRLDWFNRGITGT